LYKKGLKYLGVALLSGMFLIGCNDTPNDHDINENDQNEPPMNNEENNDNNSNNNNNNNNKPT